MRSKENNTQGKAVWKKKYLGKVGFRQAQTQPLMDFLITLCHAVIGNHLPKAQQGQASVTSVLQPKKFWDRLLWPSTATTAEILS